MTAPTDKQTNSPQSNPYHSLDFPMLGELLSPRRQVRWLWRFIENWFYSRRYELLPVVLVMIVAIAAAAVFLWKIRGTGSQQQIVDNFRVAAAKAEQAEDLERAVFYRSNPDW